MFMDNARRGGIVNHDGASPFGDASQHRETEVTFVGRGVGALSPEVLAKAPIPLTIVVDELAHVLGFGQLPKQKVVEYGVVQDDHSGFGERSAVNLRVERVVADVVQRDIAAVGGDIDVSVVAQFAEQRAGVVGDSGPRGGKRRVESDGHR
jgi:hypothetical protein